MKSDSNSKTRVRFVYVLPEVLHGDFLSEIKYLFNLEGNILHINQKCYSVKRKQTEHVFCC
jgi:glycerol-3-phosphate responsive antiterminator